MQEAATKSSQYILDRWRQKEIELKGESAFAKELEVRLDRGASTITFPVAFRNVFNMSGYILCCRLWHLCYT